MNPRSQSPAGSAADFHALKQLAQQVTVLSQSPAGSAADFHVVGDEMKEIGNLMSQSPAGSAADFHQRHLVVALLIALGRNPPQGPPPISTQMIRGPPALYDSCRNPPQGPPPISTYLPRTGRSDRRRVAIPRRVRRRFPQCSTIARLSNRTGMSQSPAGSGPPPISTLPRAQGAWLRPHVAIPRRVRRRFPQHLLRPAAHLRQRVAIPRRVRRRFPRIALELTTKHSQVVSQSPAGSAADFHNEGESNDD